MSSTLGAALTARRTLGATESVTLFWGVAILVALGAVTLRWPRGIAYPLGVMLLWLALSWLLQGIKVLRRRDRSSQVVEGATTRRIDAA